MEFLLFVNCWTQGQHKQDLYWRVLPERSTTERDLEELTKEIDGRLQPSNCNLVKEGSSLTTCNQYVASARLMPLRPMCLKIERLEIHSSLPTL